MQTQTEPIVASCRPLRDFLLQLPLLPVNEAQEIDYAAADPALLVHLAANADTCQRTAQRGISGIGYLLAHAAPEIEQAGIPGDCIEAVGFVLAELGDLASVAHSLAAACHRYSADYAPSQMGSSPCVKP
jgi:hypothetical protein